MFPPPAANSLGNKLPYQYLLDGIFMLYLVEYYFRIDSARASRGKQNFSSGNLSVESREEDGVGDISPVLTSRLLNENDPNMHA